METFFQPLRGIANLLLLRVRLNLWRVHPLRFSPRLNAIPIDRPVFLLGTQGGGLTLLARMLHRHPNVVYATGNSTYWAGPDELQNVMGSLLPAELTGLNHKVPPHPRYPNRNWLYATDELLPLYRRRAADATSSMARQFQRAIRLAIGMYARDPSQARFVDKSQSYTVRVALVNALLESFDPHFILVTRNPYAMVYRAATASTPISRLDIPREERLRLAAQHWRNSFQCALEDKLELKHLFMLRFEDLLQAPEKHLRNVCTFASLPFHVGMLPQPDHRFPLGSTGSSRGDHKWYPLRPGVNRRYLEKLTAWTLEIIEPIIGPLARQWQYTPEGP